MVALYLSLALEDADGQVVGPASTVVEALAYLESAPLAGAILDVNLADRDVTPVALELARRKVPFVFHTSMGVPPILRSTLPTVPVLMKPIAAGVVLERLFAWMRAEPVAGSMTLRDRPGTDSH